MNLALSTVVLLFLLSPGFVFRFCFLSGPYSKEVYKPSATEDIVWSIIVAIFLQLSAISLLDLWGHVANLQFLYSIVKGDDADKIDFSAVNSHTTFFLIYALILLLIASVLGLLLRKLVIGTNLDMKYSFLKINNDWYYIFSGRILQEKVKLIDFIQIDALVNTSEGEYIYCGILEDFFLTKEGGLDRLYLKNVYRRKLVNDIRTAQKYYPQSKKFDERYYSMPGEYFVIFHKNVLNLNVTYYQLEEGEEA